MHRSTCTLKPVMVKTFFDLVIDILHIHVEHAVQRGGGGGGSVILIQLLITYVLNYSPMSQTVLLCKEKRIKKTMAS